MEIRVSFYAYFIKYKLCYMGLGLFISFGSINTIVLFSLISFFSGMLWSADFSFRRRMLADRLEQVFIAKGLAIDVTSTHATRLIAMFIGGILFLWNHLKFFCFFYLLFIAFH